MKKLYRIRENNVRGIFTYATKGTPPYVIDDNDFTNEQIFNLIVEDLNLELDYCSCCGERWSPSNLQSSPLDSLDWRYCNI